LKTGPALGTGAEVLLTKITDLPGLWRRTLLALPDGHSDETTDVYWLQGPAYYADLRVPAGRPDFSGVSCLRDLTPAQVEWMAGQECFAGRLESDGAYFEWRRDMDYQPRNGAADAGRLSFAGDLLVEEGRDVAYIEHWRRGREASAPCVGVRLREATGERFGFIVRVGDSFMTARGRPGAIEDQGRLPDRVASAKDLTEAQDVVDMEVSFGSISAQGWLIERSSLPFREGARFSASRSEHTIVTSDVSPGGTPMTRRWTVLDTDGAADPFSPIAPPL
jgi:hypothetical protein